MLRLLTLCILGIVLTHAQNTQTKSPPDPEYSNGILELIVEHAKQEPGVTRKEDNLYGILTITLKNVSRVTVKPVFGSPSCDFSVEIHDSSGKSPNRTQLGEALPRSAADEPCESISYQLIDLEPGKEHHERLFINRYFQLQPGRQYDIKLTWLRNLQPTPSGRQLRRGLSSTLTIK